MTILGLGSYGVAWKIGVPGYEQPEMPLDAFGLLRLADELGLKLVQYADNLSLDALSSDDQARLRDEADERKMLIEVGTRGIETDHLHRWIEIATFFASPILRVVVDTKTHHPEPDEVIRLVQAALPALQSSGVTLAIENHDRFKVQTLADIVATLNHPQVGICLDTVNSFGSLEGPEVVIRTLAPYVVNLHIKEFIIRRADHNMGFIITGASAGQGMLDTPHLLATLRQYGRSFNAILETWLAPEATMEATVRLEADRVRESVAYLRQYIQN